MSTLATIILAAGQGTRMKSEHAKVLHALAGEPMIHYPIRLALSLRSTETVVVVGHQADRVRQAASATFAGALAFALQAEQRGTGHAVIEGMKAIRGTPSRVLILYGDVPLLRRETVEGMLARMDADRLALAFITAELDDPTGYGRVIRTDAGDVAKIVEHKDASDVERAVREINAGIYCVDSQFLSSALSRLRSDNAQREYYLTDIVGSAIADHLRVAAVKVDDATEILGINSRAQLAETNAILRVRIARALMDSGVTLVDPNTTLIGPAVEIGQDTILEPGVHLRGRSTVGKNCHIDVGSVLIDATIGDDVEIHPHSVVEGATVARGASIGPFARLRPGAEIMDDAKVGNFVEIKKSRLGKGAKANHLSYLGDAVIGEGANIGAGTITCNYDGHGKYRTDIGARVFVGSNATLVAPLKIGDDAYVAAGSTVTAEVGSDDLAFGRSRQVNKKGMAAVVRRRAAEMAENAKKK